MKYKIIITETFVNEIEIDANSMEEAIAKGETYYFDGGFAADHMGVPTDVDMKVEAENESVEGIEL